MTGPRAAALLAWYRAERRDLPWRGETDPYRVLVSEVMLQQTQAARVARHYPGFVARFPTAADLAAAPLAAVLAAWSGLGYNRRAQRLREACRAVVRDGWPHTADGLAALPGVGPYTAAAVACFAFGEQVAAADTNARRVLSRWRGEPLRGAALSTAAAAALTGDAGEWNQALMDLGATVCTARRPHCDRCPVAQWCAGPAAYDPPRPQGTFAGSNRQLRGALIRDLVAGPATAERIARSTGFAVDDVRAALAQLEADCMVEPGGGGGEWRLAG